MIQITKTFTFDSGHRLSNYEGKCRHLHGHTYHLEVTISGELDKLGMVMDFGDLKEIFKGKVDAKFDHKMMLYRNDDDNVLFAEMDNVLSESIVWVDYNPTAENIAQDIFNIIRADLPAGIMLEKVKLYETPTSFAVVEA